MPTYSVNAINIGSFALGEADKVLTVFSQQRGLIKAVAKGARKPGAKIGGRADVLSANKLLLSTGRTFEIITQAQTIESFPEFRTDLTRMSYALYYAELTQHFGQGLGEESEFYYDLLLNALRLQARCQADPAWLCLEFEMALLGALGYQLELTYCIGCRGVLGDYNLGRFHADLGGIACQTCTQRQANGSGYAQEGACLKSNSASRGAHVTPLVWKNLVVAAQQRLSQEEDHRAVVKLPVEQSIHAARRLLKAYIEYLSGKTFKALDLLAQVPPP